MDNSALWVFFAFLRESAPADAIRCRRRISLAGFFLLEGKESGDGTYPDAQCGD